MERKGGWITTFTGKTFYPFDPRAEEINLEDIAHALSLKCRWGGFTKVFYSVAQHSVHVSYHCEPSNALAGLMHDSQEAYMPGGDIPSPIKHDLREMGVTIFDRVEEDIYRVIAYKYGLPLTIPKDVKAADDGVRYAETMHVMNGGFGTWSNKVYPHLETLPGAKIEIVPWDWEMAKRLFLERFHELRRGT